MKLRAVATYLLLAIACSQDAREETTVTEQVDSTPYILRRCEGEVLMDSRGRTTIIKVSPETGSRLLAMGATDMPPGSNIIVHKHDRTEEILYVTEGSGTLILGDEEFQVEKHTTIWIPPGTWHGLENPDDHVHVLWFVTPPGLDGFLRGVAWPPGDEPKELTLEELTELEQLHDSKAKP